MVPGLGSCLTNQMKAIIETNTFLSTAPYINTNKQENPTTLQGLGAKKTPTKTVSDFKTGFSIYLY